MSFQPISGCREECDNGRIWNNADPTSGQWVQCQSCVFTPGPWHIFSSGRLASEDALSRFEIGHGLNSYGDGPEGIVAKLERTTEANARLMAAAPDLLEALEELHLKAVVGTDDERHAALNKAWAAIAKATGAA